MSCWELLGIPPTGDLEAIKAAFAVQSKLHHPEEDPEGFSNIKHAYRQAKQFAEAQQLFSAKGAPQLKENPSGLQRPAETTVSGGAFAFRGAAPDHLAGLDGEKTIGNPYSFSKAERIEITEDQYYGTVQSEHVRALRRKERHRRRMRSFKTLSPLLRSLTILVVLIVAMILAAKQGLFNQGSNNTHSGYVPLIPSNVDLSYAHVEKLQSQARILLEDETENRRQTLDNIGENTPYSICQAAAALQISPADYDGLLETYTVQGEEAVKEALDAFTQGEADFIRDKILPFIKAGVMQRNGMIQAVTVGSMVGMTQQECFLLFAEFVKDGDEAKLDQALLRYNRLAPPEQWGFDMNSDNGAATDTGSSP